MGTVIQLPKRNIQQVRTADLKQLWDNWSGEPDEMLGEFEHETVYFELNRRGEGKYCAV